MKKIIALYGCADTGKTHTLNHLIGLLDKTKEVYGDDLAKDGRAFIPYGNKKIAVTTWGDNGDELKKNIEFFEEGNCDILVTATRTRGGSSKNLNDYASENGIKIVWIEKNTSIILKDLINQTQAKDIQAVINTLINNDH